MSAPMRIPPGGQYSLARGKRSSACRSRLSAAAFDHDPATGRGIRHPAWSCVRPYRNCVLRMWMGSAISHCRRQAKGELDAQPADCARADRFQAGPAARRSSEMAYTRRMLDAWDGPRLLSLRGVIGIEPYHSGALRPWRMLASRRPRRTPGAGPAAQQAPAFSTPALRASARRWRLRPTSWGARPGIARAGLGDESLGALPRVQP